MKIRCLLFLGLLACLFGCAPVDSLNPLYDPHDDTIYDETLIGTWVFVDSTEGGALEIGAVRSNDKVVGYTLAALDRNHPADSGMEFEAQLVKLAGHRFLDVVPKNWHAMGDSYSLQIKSGKNQTVVEPSILRLSMAAYLRFSPGDRAGKLQADLIPGHWFLRITMKGANMQFDSIDDDKFRDAFQASKFHIGGMLLNDKKDVVITASTPELQKFIAEHADDDTLFTEHGNPMQKQP